MYGPGMACFRDASTSCPGVGVVRSRRRHHGVACVSFDLVLDVPRSLWTTCSCPYVCVLVCMCVCMCVEIGEGPNERHLRLFARSCGRECSRDCRRLLGSPKKVVVWGGERVLEGVKPINAGAATRAFSLPRFVAILGESV